MHIIDINFVEVDIIISNSSNILLQTRIEKLFTELSYLYTHLHQYLMNISKETRYIEKKVSL